MNSLSSELDSYYSTMSDSRPRYSSHSVAISPHLHLRSPTISVDHSLAASSRDMSTIPFDTLHNDHPSEYSQSSFIIVADSHAKSFPPIFSSSHYSLITRSISGLQWFNPRDTDLCATSLIQSTSLSSLLSSSAGIFFLISTNSVRTTSAVEIIDQVANIIRLIRSHHPHLSNKHHISIISPFPCLRTSSSFRRPDDLSANIEDYALRLRDLSTRLDFSFVDLQLEARHLSWDGMHLQHPRQKILFDSIRKYFEELVQCRSNPKPPRRRSRTAITARNRKRHQKLLEKQREFTLIRNIDRCWHLRDIKQILTTKNIKYTRLPEVYNHKLRVQFNTLSDLQHAEQLLADDQFNENNYLQWTSQ